MLGLFYLVAFVKNAKRVGLYLIFSFLILLAYNLLFVYLSNIHPFYFIIVLLITFVAPYTLKRLRSVIFLSLILCALSFMFIFFISITQIIFRSNLLLY